MKTSPSMSSQKEQVKPLAPGGLLPKSPAETATSGDVEVARTKPSKRRRYAVRCCAWCGATVVALGIVVLVLALTVFKVKDPVMTMNSVTVEDVKIDLGEHQDRPLSVNATVSADISIKNPNAASFRFRSSTTEFYYRGQTVGVAYAPNGNARAHLTERMNVTVDVFADRVVAVAEANPRLALDAILGKGLTVDLSSYTEVRGRVSVWGIYKRSIDVKMKCTMTLEYVLFTRQDITNKVCVATVN